MPSPARKKKKTAVGSARIPSRKACMLARLRRRNKARVLFGSPCRLLLLLILFFFNDTATPEIYTLSLHDALPISHDPGLPPGRPGPAPERRLAAPARRERKSTRLNSSHEWISYAVFSLNKKM